MDRLAPTEFSGWKSAGDDRQYGPRKIYDYLNGGAEAYLEYGLAQLFVRTYRRPRNPEVNLLLFDMGRSEDAYGIFTLEREGAAAGIGRDSDYDAGLLRFWRGRHFVSISCQRVSSTTTAAILALGKAVADRIPDGGRRPAQVGWLPAEDLDEGSVRFVHSMPWLSHHLTLPGDNVLDLDRETAVALGSYGSGGDRRDLLIVEYPPRASTGAASSGSRAERARLALARGGRPAASKTCGRVLIAVFGGDESSRKSLLGGSSSKVPECGHEKRQRKK